MSNLTRVILTIGLILSFNYVLAETSFNRPAVMNPGNDEALGGNPNNTIKGNISVSSTGFHQSNSILGCQMRRNTGESIYMGFDTGKNCSGYAHVQLLDKSVISKIRCTVTDNNNKSGAHIRVSLRRMSMSVDGGSGGVLSTSASQTTNAGERIHISGTTAGHFNSERHTIDNDKYAYFLLAQFSHEESSVDMRLYGCTISYVISK